MDPDGAPMLSDSPDGEKPAQVNGREHLLGHEETRENADAVPDEDSASGRRGPSSGLRAASQSSEMRTGKGPSDWAMRESSVASRQRTRGDAEERLLGGLASSSRREGMGPGAQAQRGGFRQEPKRMGGGAKARRLPEGNAGADGHLHRRLPCLRAARSRATGWERNGGPRRVHRGFPVA